MINDKPRVSIGMPVYNGERYLKEALNAILAQTYSEFELIISDNASSDNTPKICQSYAAKDRRIRYHRNARNIGASRNFNSVFELSSGDYFRWAAHDDLIAPDYLLKCVKVLEQDPSVVLCHSKIKVIDESGKILSQPDIREGKGASLRPQDRFYDIITDDRSCLEVFGLIRANVLKMTPLIGSFIASDRPLLAELGLRGRFYIIPECLFFSRDHPERSIRIMPAHHLRAAWFDPANTGKKIFPHWRTFFEYFKCVWRVSLTRYERVCCCLFVLLWLRVDLNWARMISDLFIAVVPQSWKLFFKLSKVRRAE